MQPKKWDWSDMNEESYRQYKTVSEGEQYIYINDVMYDKDLKKFTLYLMSLTDNAEFRQYMPMMKKDLSGPNYMSLKWMNNLGYACSGYRTVLQPDEMKGCVFLGTITMEPSLADKARWEEDLKTKGVSDVKLYVTIRPETIQPVNRDLEPFSTHVDENGEKDQFFVDE